MVSNIEYPRFLIDTISLLLIKFLTRKATLMIVTKGIISLNIEGYFKRDKYRKLIIFLLSSDTTLDNSNIFINIINNENIKKFINKYLLVSENKYIYLHKEILFNIISYICHQKNDHT